MTFDFEFVVTEREQIRASRVVGYRRRVIRTLLGSLAAAAIALSVLVASGLFRGPWASISLSASWAGFASGALAAYVAPRSVVKSLRKQNRAASGPQTFGMSGSGLVLTAVGVSSSLEWANIREVFESREFLLFYVSVAWAHMLPKRVIPAESLPALRSALLEWVGTRAHLARGPEPFTR